MLFDRTVTQHASRVKVGFRLILLIPHAILLFFYGVAAAVVLLVAWFAALFTARVPDGMYNFLGGYVAYYARVASYAALLTDRWPTVSVNDPYPVVFRLTGPGRLNRAAVLFRLVLFLPAGIVISVVTTGAQLVSIVNWFIVLIRGRMPAPMFDAYASTARFYMRGQAYFLLLTPTYPAGLFGDAQDGTDIQAETAPADVPRTPFVGRVARRLIVLFLVVGAAGNIAQEVVRITSASAHDKALKAESDLYDAYHGLHFGSFTSCSSPATVVSCYQETARQDVEAISAFQEDVRAIDFPADVHADVVKMNAAVQKFKDDLTAISVATTRSQLKTLVTGMDLAGDGQAFDTTISALGHELDAES